MLEWSNSGSSLLLSLGRGDRRSPTLRGFTNHTMASSGGVSDWGGAGVAPGLSAPRPWRALARAALAR
jgi:hypothetical protein